MSIYDSPGPLVEASGNDRGIDLNMAFSSNAPPAIGTYTKFSEEDAILLKGSQSLKPKWRGLHAFTSGSSHWKGVALVVFVCALLSLGSGIITAFVSKSSSSGCASSANAQRPSEAPTKLSLLEKSDEYGRFLIIVTFRDRWIARSVSNPQLVLTDQSSGVE